MNCITPGLPVHHQLPEFTQTHVHRVGDAIQPSHPLSSPSPPAPNPSQHQGLFQWVNSSHEVTKVLEFQPQHQSFQWTPRTGLLEDGRVGSPCSPRNSQESSPAPQFKSINSSVLAFFMVQLSHLYMTTGKTMALTIGSFVLKVMSLLFNTLSRFKVKVKLLSHVWFFATPWTVGYQVPPSVGFSRQEYWSGLPFPSPGDLPNAGIEPGSPTL